MMCLYKGREEKPDAQIQEGGRCDKGGREWRDAAPAKECQEPPEAGKGKDMFPGAVRGSVTLPKP